MSAMGGKRTPSRSGRRELPCPRMAELVSPELKSRQSNRRHVSRSSQSESALVLSGLMPDGGGGSAVGAHLECDLCIESLEEEFPCPFCKHFQLIRAFLPEEMTALTGHHSEIGIRIFVRANI